MLQGVVGELRGHVRDLTERLLAQVDDVESVMASTIPQEFREAEPVQEVVEEEFETVYEADDSDQSEEGYGQSPEESDERSDERSDELDERSDEESDEEAVSEAETGEVYLGSDRRPWERYGD